MPVGLINTSWGGTRAEAWTSKPALHFLHPQFTKPMLLNKTNRKRLEVIFRTAESTALIGQRVNLEVDMLARYVARLLEHGKS